MTPSQWVIDISAMLGALVGASFIIGYFGVLFFVFSGRVELQDPTVSTLVGSVITGISTAVVLILGHYFSKGTETAERLQSLEKKESSRSSMENTEGKQ